MIEMFRTLLRVWNLYGSKSIYSHSLLESQMTQKQLSHSLTFLSALPFSCQFFKFYYPDASLYTVDTSSFQLPWP